MSCLQFNKTPLYYAAVFNNAACVRALMEHGADPSIRARDGNITETVLSVARNMNCLAALAVLGEFGVDE